MSGTAHLDANFQRHIEVVGECWMWRGATDRHGYGYLGRGRRTWAAHRWSYSVIVGPIPDGLDLDHLCRHPSCVNPAHLEPVTHAENMRRAVASRTSCKNGHEWTPENTRIRLRKNGTLRRCCRACDREAKRLATSRRKRQAIA